jgi:hypothetical protein
MGNYWTQQNTPNNEYKLKVPVYPIWLLALNLPVDGRYHGVLTTVIWSYIG